jgi:dTMP kinase
MAAPAVDTPTRGVFVSFEGGEGAGKSTQIERLRRRLKEEGRQVLVTREPGGSDRAERIRSILLSGHAKRFGSFGEAALFAAARADHVSTVVAPALRRGCIVLCDRFVDSTRVYQGHVAGVPRRLLDALEDATGGRLPDLTIMIDLPSATGLERARARRLGEEADRFEAESAAFHEKVRRAFLAIAAGEPARCTVVDGEGAPDEVARAVWSAVAPRLPPLAG